MSRNAIAIADSIVEAINAKSDYSNGYSIAANRRLMFNLKADNEKIQSVRVDVVPVTYSATAGARRLFDEDHTTRVFVANRLPRDVGQNTFSESTCEEMFLLVEEIQTQIIQYGEANTDKLRLMGGFSNDPMMDDEFAESGIFLSVTEFTHRTCREV